MYVCMVLANPNYKRRGHTAIDCTNKNACKRRGGSFRCPECVQILPTLEELNLGDIGLGKPNPCPK